MDTYITGYVHLSQGKLILNEESIFEQDVVFDELIQHIVTNFEVKHPRFGKMDRLAKLGYTCAEILLKQVEGFKKYNPFNVSLLFANASSSLDTDFRFQKTMDTLASPALFVYTLPNIVLAEISIKNGFKGEHLFLISDAPDANLFYEPVNQMFVYHKTKACLAGWVEIFGDDYNCTLFTVELLHDENEKTKKFNLTNLDTLLRQF
jgi:hypothetical protein